MAPSVFGPPSRWRRGDLIGVSADFTPELVLQAYREGVFPMPHPGVFGQRRVAWFSPDPRAVLPLDALQVSRSLRKTAKRYQIRFDTAFGAVLEGCADPRRPYGWIDEQIRAVYTELHRRGVVHSVEAWTLPADGSAQLAGGLYGVSIGGLFAGESMFHRADIGRDASKAALIGLVELLRSAGGAGRLLDVQWLTPHLATLGAQQIPRAAYLRALARALELPPPGWPTS